jgi:DNA-directed RNA polymerase subunit F
MNPKVQEETPISIYDLQKEIKKIKKRDAELSIRAGKTEEYINQFTTLKVSDADALEKDLMGLDIPRFKESHVKKILDLLPESVDELKVILQGYTLTISKENMEKVVKTVQKYLPKTESS